MILRTLAVLALFAASLVMAGETDIAQPYSGQDLSGPPRDFDCVAKVAPGRNPFPEKGTAHVRFDAEASKVTVTLTGVTGMDAETVTNTYPLTFLPISATGPTASWKTEETEPEADGSFDPEPNRPGAYTLGTNVPGHWPAWLYEENPTPVHYFGLFSCKAEGGA